MKNTKVLSLFVSVLVAILAISTVMAGTLDIANMEVTVSDVANSIVGAPGDSIDLEVKLQSNEDITDAKIRAWISGYKDDIDTSTARFDVISGKTYLKSLSLRLPTTFDIEDLDEDLTLRVEISDKNDEYEAAEYTITVQKESYNYNVLSVEAPSQASAGEIVAVDVVLKNIGRKELEDSFVTVRIPELGVSKKVYFGDIAPEDNFAGDEDAEDAVARRVYIVVPTDAISGEYDLTVKASNYDTNEEVVKSLTIAGLTAEDNVIDTTNDNKGISNSVIVLTVVLVIVFLVLLIVLIVLLTKRPAERVEDFGETSYY